RVHFLSFGHVAVSYARAIVLGHDNPSPVPTFGFEPIPEGSRVASFSTACHPSYVRWRQAFSTACHPSYVRWRQAEVESLPELLDWATSQVRNAEAGIGKGLAGEQWESAKGMEAQLDQVRRASVADPVVQLDLGLNTAATEALITSFSTQITSDPMRALVRLGQAAREGFRITVGSYVGDNDTHSVRFSLMMGYYIIEDIKEGDATWPRQGKLGIYVEGNSNVAFTPFAAHANAAAHERYGRNRWAIEVDGFPGQTFDVVQRDQARSTCHFMVGARPRRKDNKTEHRINQLLRLMESVKLAHSIDTRSPFSRIPWAFGFEGNRQPIWEPSGVGHGGQMALVQINEEPLEPLLLSSFPRSHCLDRDLLLRALWNASLRLIRGKRAEWLLQELDFDVAKALDELKAAPYVTNFDVWLRASWTSAHGYRVEATAINKDPATKANVFDVRGAHRYPTVSKSISALFKLVRAVQEGQAQIARAGGIRALASPGMYGTEFDPSLTEKELGTRVMHPEPPINFRPTGHSARDADMFKLQEGTSTYIKTWGHSYRLLGVYIAGTQ
ncbi:hypothetical protein CF319_g9352, partial [Tilletia indica]